MRAPLLLLVAPAAFAQDIYQYMTPASSAPASSAPAYVTVQAGGALNIGSGGALTVGVSDGSSSTEQYPDAMMYMVSGGSFTSPYYKITDMNGNVVEPSFMAGKSYVFKADSMDAVSNSHPFFIGMCSGGSCSPWADKGMAYNANGDKITGMTGSISFTVPATASQICYYCTQHPDPMMKCFSVG